MERRRALTTVLPVLVMALAALLAFATHALDEPYVYDLIKGGMFAFENHGDTFRLSEGDAYGVLPSTGPDLTLPPGVYRLHVVAETDGEENALRLRCGNNTTVEPGELTLDAGWSERDYAFTVSEDAEGFNIEVSFQSGEYLSVHKMILYTPVYNDRAWSLLFFFTALSVLWVLGRRGYFSRERKAALVFLGAAVLLSCAPSFKSTVLRFAHDLYFHAMRIEGLANGLKNGQFPVRLYSNVFHGFGTVAPVFYPDVFLYPCALMLLGGASLSYIVNAFYAAVNAAAAAAMYACARRIFADRKAATVSGILYALASYRIADVYIRGAFGEIIAMAFLPLFILGLWETLRADGSKRAYALLAVSAACIFLCHMLTTLLCAVLAALFAAAYAPQIVRGRRVGQIVKAAVLTLALCLFQLFPLVDLSRTGIDTQMLIRRVWDSAVEPAQLFTMSVGTLEINDGNPRIPDMPVEIGLPLLLGFVVLFCILWICPRAEERKREGVAGLFAVVGLGFCAAATTVFPWWTLSRLTGGISNYIQFPWRMLAVGVPLLALAGGYAIARAGGWKILPAALCLCALCAAPMINALVLEANCFPAGLLIGRVNQNDYTIADTNIYTVLDSPATVNTEGGVTVEGYEKRDTLVTAQVDAQTDAQIELPLFGYAGYAATLDGEPLDWTLGENNRLSIALPAGAKGELRVWYRGNPLWRITDLLSLIAWLSLPAGGLIRRRGRRTRSKKQASGG